MTTHWVEHEDGGGHWASNWEMNQATARADDTDEELSALAKTLVSNDSALD